MSGNGGGRAGGHYRRAVGWNLHGCSYAGQGGLRIGCAVDSVLWSVGAIPRHHMRAIAPEKDGDGKRCGQEISAGKINVLLMQREVREVVGCPHRGDDQRVSTGQSGKGGRPGCSQETALSDSGVPFPRGGRAILPSTFNAFIYLRAARCKHAMVGAIVTHRSRAC
jgi:hypothetical protein